MMTEYITLASFVLAIFVFGVAVGKLVDKIERLDRREDNEEHNDTNKNKISASPKEVNIVQV